VKETAADLAPARFDVERLWQAFIYGLGALILLFVLGVVLYPSLVLVYNSFLADGRLSISNYALLLTSAGTYRVLQNSLVVSLAGTLGATSLGVLLAWLVARTDVPYRAFWRTILVIPYLIPPFIGAIAWVYLLGPVGFINRFWIALTGSPLAIVYGPAGIVLVMILYSYPIAYLVTLGPFEKSNPALEEAARISGAGVFRTLRDVTLRLLSPNIWAAGLLIFMSLMANFGIPAVLGLPRRYFVLTTRIYTTILNFDQANNLQIAAALSMVLVVIAFVGLQIQYWVLSRGGRFTVVTGQASQPQRVELGKWRPLATGFLVTVALVTIVAPLVAILITSLMRAVGLPLALSSMSLDHYQQLLFGVPKVPRAFLNSLLLAAGSATLIAFLALAVGYLVARMRVAGGRVLEGLLLIPYAVPGTVVALAMILAFLRPLPVLGFSLYNTIWILLIAYVIRFLTFGIRSTTAAFEQIHTSLEEAARISGAGLLAAIRDVTLPLIKSSVMAGWFLAFMPALTELTLSILLYSVNNETLGVVVFGLHQEGKTGLTAALALLVTLFVLALNWLGRGRLGLEE
jgi:iron(III) transport system permease protein